MSATPETSPHDENFNGEAPTVFSFAQECADFADQDTRFASGERLMTSVEYGWMDRFDVIWAVGFTATHEMKGARHAGQAFGLDLSVRTGIGVIPQEFRHYAEAIDQPLPEQTYIGNVEISYIAHYELTNDYQLAWRIARDYVIHHTQPDIEPDMLDFNEDDDPAEIRATFMNQILKTIRGVIPLSENEVKNAPMLAITAVGSGDVLSDMELELQLAHARQIFEMLSAVEDVKIGLAKIFPEEAAQLIDDTERDN